MLASLSIKNFALIEHLHIDFKGGLSVITGETGAGKSILLEALGLVLGKRADLSSLKDKDQKCVVEAHFAIGRYNLEGFFLENDLDYEETTIIRREILPSGKSRAFINDSPVNLPELQELGDFLIDIHSQQQTRELSDEEYQMEMLDAIARNQEVISLYKKELSGYKSLRAELKKLLEKKEGLEKEQDYTTFLLEELRAANLKAGEQEEMEALLEKLNNTGLIKESLAKALAIAGAEEIGLLHNLKETRLALQKISGLAAEYHELSERVSSMLIEAGDIEEELAQLSEKLSDDPEKLEEINQKLQLIYTLQKKHHAGTVEELLAIQQDLEAGVAMGEGIDDAIKELEEGIAGSSKKLDGMALEIYNKRNAAVPVFTEKVTAILAGLGMPNALFRFDITHTGEYTATGKDKLSLLFSANKGTGFGLLKKVASGGEMSRIMLAIKAVLAGYAKLPTILFDEIDTGVSGEIAHKMGDIMKAMGREMQVFAITHLPQIAAKGQQHYKVFKSSQGDTTVSELKLLSEEERVREIAGMLSGKDISDSALTHARALLN